MDKKEEKAKNYWYSAEQESLMMRASARGSSLVMSDGRPGAKRTPRSVQKPDGEWVSYSEIMDADQPANPRFPDAVLVATGVGLRTADTSSIEQPVAETPEPDLTEELQ